MALSKTLLVDIHTSQWLVLCVSLSLLIAYNFGGRIVTFYLNVSHSLGSD